ncbi:hypothetical protein GLOTRDRAFT_133637 [Gloeophyllum trabeum ATCC 11539]|uniref:Uncharacterized protein n=1 Tax=Gloeophyllum trabeum (strain ATCC 11539 / FP-39264 / Madison 617) TaxID=670483 RepID=S7REJ1_GLOTA|nr:uncharacterized protein GLOTRDRAFT_133637 [Gloeophyllum trabeum ATCC 11539]EPQ50899.1 hypothetical protein GLOTRDRAFT_133637 [Gloeophyllum trabeum ATCC 11539]
MATSSVQHDVSIRVTSHSRRLRRVSGQASIKSPPVSESRTPRQGRAIGYPRTKASTGSSQGYEPDDEASCVASVEKVRSWQERLNRPKGGKGCIGEQERANEHADLPQGLQQGTNPRPSSVRNSTAAVTRMEYPQIETTSRAEDVRPPSIFPTAANEAAFTGEIARTSQPQERAAADNQSTSSTHRSSEVGKPKSARNSIGDCRIILPPSPYEREVVVYPGGKMRVTTSPPPPPIRRAQAPQGPIYVLPSPRPRSHSFTDPNRAAHGAAPQSRTITFADDTRRHHTLRRSSVTIHSPQAPIVILPSNRRQARNAGPVPVFTWYSI